MLKRLQAWVRVSARKPLRVLAAVVSIGGLLLLVRYREPIWFVAEPTDAAGFWEMIEAIFNGALFVAAVIGLRSLVLTKRAMLTQAKRDARACAIARCEEWAREVIPRNGEIFKIFAQHKVQVFVKTIPEVRFDPDNFDEIKNAQAWLKALPEGVPKMMITHLNALEGWAMYFTHALADPDVAFGPCAPTYCTHVLQYYPMLLVLRANRGSGKFPNVVKLFKAWTAKFEMEQDGQEMRMLLKQLGALQSKGPAPVDPLPPPLGTDGG